MGDPHDNIGAALATAEEQRRSARRPLALQVRMTSPGGLPRSFLTYDVGPRGMFLRTGDPLELGVKAQLTFALPRCAMITLDAEVAWNTRRRAAGGKVGMGLRFTRVRNEDAEVLRGFFGLDRTAGRRVVIVENDPLLRARLRNAYQREGLDVSCYAWSEAEVAFGVPHALAVVGVDTAGMRSEVAKLRRGARSPVVALAGSPAIFEEWMGRDAMFCFAKPADVQRVVQMSLCMVK